MRVIKESTYMGMRPNVAKRGNLVVVTSHARTEFVGLKGIVTQSNQLIVFDSSPNCWEWDDGICEEYDILVRYARPDEFITLAGDEE